MKRLLLFTTISMMMGCQAAPKIDMSTDVEVVHGAEPMKLGEVLAPFPKTLPASFLSFPGNTSCKMLRARGGSIVANVTGYEGGKRRAPMFFVYPRQYVENPGTPERVVKSAYSLAKPRVTDVVVTETSKPVNLVLTSHDATLWVIHSAEGVKLESINVMSFEGAAVIAPQVQRKQVNFLVRGKDSRQRCWKSPERYSNAKERAAVKPANYTRTSKDYEKYRKEEKEYKQWLSWVQQKVGRITNPIDREYRVESALVGSPPEQLIAPTAIGGDIYVDHSRGDVFWGSKKDAEKKFPPPPKR